MKKLFVGSIHRMSTKANNNEISIYDLKRLCTNGLLTQAMQTLRDDVIDCHAYVCLLQACSKKRASIEGKLIHAHIIVSKNSCAFMRDPIVPNCLITMYDKCGELPFARQVFDAMPRRNSCSWTVMIAAYSKVVSRRVHQECLTEFRSNRLKIGLQEGLNLFHEMLESGIEASQFTFASVVAILAKVGLLGLGMEVHGLIIRKGFESDVVVRNALVDMYAKCGSIGKARQVFDEMFEPDVVAWTAMIGGYAKGGCLIEAMNLFARMPHRDQFARTVMITGLAENEMVDAAWELFEGMVEPSLISWNAMLAAFSQNERGEDAMKLFRQMQMAGVRPDGKTFASVLPSCGESGALEKGMEIHGKIIRSGYHFEVILVNAIIDMYAKCGRVEKAHELFDIIPEPDVISWTSLISGYAQNGKGDVALNLFWQMQSEGIRPDLKTYASIFSVCANLAALDQGMEIHHELVKSGLKWDLPVMNSLIDMYSKCGRMCKAYEIFNTIPQRNVVSWTTIIAGYALHGCGKEAIQLFEEMKHCNTRPDEVTFVCVLSACNHAGLVDEGYKHFNCMIDQYKIIPTMEHYSCMVDLLSRAGHLDEAHDFIKKMPIRPDASIWCSLLSACKIHNYLELGEYVAEHIFKMNPMNHAPYILLSNIYAAVGKWDDLRKLRKVMKDRGIKKTPGSSWIEVDKHVHVFVVGDESELQL